MLPGNLHHGGIYLHHIQLHAGMSGQQLLGVGKARASDHEHALGDKRTRGFGQRRLEQVVEGAQIREGTACPTLVGVGGRLQHAAHVQHAHERTVFGGHGVHRGLAEARGKRLPLRPPPHLVQPAEQRPRPSRMTATAQCDARRAA